ncbi:MAG TPA: hypothetical protein VFO47_09655 [Actinomycetes bacterium]|nr:hypothetical protein [Actinomycetes bacterium]
MEPNTPFYRRWSYLLAGVIGLAVVVALLGWRGFTEAGTSATTSTATPVTTVAPPTTTQPETTVGPTSKPYDILWEELASEASTLRSEGFEAPPVWRIEWAFDCSNFGDYGGGNFKITGDGDFQQEIQIEKRAVRYNGTTPVRRGGFGHLYIETVCEQWTVRALSG